MKYYNVYFYEDEQIDKYLYKFCGRKESYTAIEVARCIGLQGVCNTVETFTDIADAEICFRDLSKQAETYGHIGTDIIKASYAVLETYCSEGGNDIDDIEILDIGTAPYTRES